MKKARKAIRSVCILLTLGCSVVFSFCISMSKKLPDDYIFNKNEQLSVSSSRILSLRKKMPVAAENDLSDGQLMFMNIIPVKDVNLHMREKKYVVPCGNIFGIKFYSKGAVVIKCTDIPGDRKNTNPGKNCGLQQGDTIIEINNKKVLSCADVENEVKNSGGKPMTLSYDRSGTVFETAITPVMSDDNEYRLGLWIRDSCAGLGTMTFYDPDTGCFASLGHGISDNDTGDPMLLHRAFVTQARISSITKGSDGITGSIKFVRDYYSKNNLKGAIIGISGGKDSAVVLAIFVKALGKENVVGVTMPCNSNVEDRADAEMLGKYYDIEITRVDYDENNKTKNLMISATDERLLAKTGGIIRGMSGSPILQNGKLIGAVTHVLVTNSSKGYGIFAQNMYTEMENCLISGEDITSL